MKQLFFVLTIGVVLLGSFISAVTGAAIMVYDIVTHGDQFMKGFELCGIGSVLFIVSISAYMISENQTSLNNISHSLGDFMQYDIDRENELRHVIQLLQIQNNNTHEFQTEEERDQVIANAMGLKLENAKRKIEIMSVEELNEARAQAVSNQEFEYAAALRDAIQRKKEKKA
jgi:hypothetical protein